MSNLIDIANAIDILITEGRVKEKDSVEKVYILISNNKIRFNLDFEIYEDDVKNVLRNKKKYRLDETFETYKNKKPSEEFKDENSIFEKRKTEIKNIYKVLNTLYKNKEFDIDNDSASKIYKLIQPRISTTMEKPEVKQVIYDWANLLVSKKQNGNEEVEEEEEDIEKDIEESEKIKLESDVKRVDYDVDSVMTNIANIRKFADINSKITLRKYVSNEEREFYVKYKKNAEEDQKKLSVLQPSIQREIKKVEEVKKGRRETSLRKKTKEESVEEKKEDDVYLKLLGEDKEGVLEKKQVKIKRKPLVIKTDQTRAKEYFLWFLDNPQSTLEERISKVNENGLLLSKMEYFLKLPESSQLFYAKFFQRREDDPSFDFYKNLASYVEKILANLIRNTKLAKKKDITEYEKSMLKNFEENKKDIIEKNKEFEEYTAKVEDTVTNVLGNRVAELERLSKIKEEKVERIENAPRVDEKKVSNKDLEEHDEDDFLVEIFSPQGTYYVWYSTIEQKAEKEDKKKEDKKELGKFYDLKYEVSNFVSQRLPSNLIAISKENNRGFLYSSWAVKNPNETTAAHLNKITSLGLSPSLLGPLLRLDDETRNLFYYSIIAKFRDQEKENDIYTWTFYGLLAEFLRNLQKTQKKLYIEKLRASVKDIENLEEITAQEAEILGDDIEDLIEEKDDPLIDEGDNENDDIERLQEDIDKSRYNIDTLVNEFLEEKTEYEPGKNVELSFLTMAFLKWLYNNYPSSPQFNAIELRSVFKEKFGKDRFFVAVKSFISKSGQKQQRKIIFVKDVILTDVLNMDENELVSKARNFINLSTSYDSKSKLYMAFHMEAYKLVNEEELNELIERYSERMKSILREPISKDFIEDYKNLWKKYNLKVKSEKDITKASLDKLMNITPFVQRFLKTKTKLLKNPLIQQTGRRNNRKRNLNSKDSITSRLLSKLPSNISSTVKECLLWNQTKPYWNLNFRYDTILIAQADGATKDQMPENMRVFFGDFVYMYYIDNKPFYFYRPSRMYSLLQCHLTYNEKDIVQCRANMDNTITLYTENLSLTIYTGIYNTMNRVSDDEDVSLEDNLEKKTQSRKNTFTLVTKSMYDRECEWWKSKTSSPAVIINNLKQIKLEDVNNVILPKIISQIQNMTEIILRDVVGDKQAVQVSKYVINYLVRDKDKNVSKLIYDFVVSIYTLSKAFYPGKITRNYKYLWKISARSMSQQTVDNLMSIPIEYKFIEIYSHPEVEKREILKQIFLDEVSREVDYQIAYFYNSYYKDRPKIRAVSGKRLGYVSSADPISVTINNQLRTIEKGLLFDDDVNCYNDLDKKYKGTYIKVRGIIMNEDGEEEEKIICIRVSKLYDVYRPNYEEKYYEMPIKIDKNDYVDVAIPKEIVELVVAQVSFFDPLMYLKKETSEFVLYNGNFYNKDYVPEYVCMNEFKGDKNRLIFVKVDVKSKGKSEEKMLCMDIMKIYELYEENYKSPFYQTTENISQDVYDDEGNVIGKQDNVSVAIKIPRETVEFVKSHVDKNINKYSFQNDQPTYDHDDEVDLFCNYCKKMIESDQDVLKTYEQYADENELNGVRTQLILYCSTDCFNNGVERVPKLKERYNYNHNQDKEIKKRIQMNFMMKVLRENKIRRDRLTFFGYVSAEEFENDVMIGKITLAKFIGIVGNNVIEKYQAILYYIK